MSKKGTKLNKRVRTLFARAGFATKPSTDSSEEYEIKLPRKRGRKVDLLAEIPDLGVRLIAENKNRKSFPRSFTSYVHDLRKLADAARARTALIVSAEKEITADDKQYALQHCIHIWEANDLRYYEAIVDAIGDGAKYEMIRALGIQTVEPTPTHNILALRISQPLRDSNIKLHLFSAYPEFLLKTCTVLRKAQGDALAYQRILRRNRLAKIMKFVTEENALLPPNIIVHFGKEVNYSAIRHPTKDKNNRSINLTEASGYELGVLSIPTKYASLEIIDGQHRLFGFSKTDPATKRSFPLVVCGISGLSDSRRRDTFVAINDKARRVDPNLVAYLKHTEDELACQRNPELMAIRLVVILNGRSPFKNRIRLVDIGEGVITLKGFCGYDLKSLVGPRGLLRKHYPNNTSSDYVTALRMYFSLIKSTFRTEWDDPKKYIVCTNKGTSAFLKLLKSILRTDDAPLDKDKIGHYLSALSVRWRQGWETSSLTSSYVGSQGWKDFHREMVSAIRKTYEYFAE